MDLDMQRMRKVRHTKWNEKELEANQFKALPTIIKFSRFSMLLLFVFTGCTSQKAQPEQFASLAEARSGFKTNLLPQKGVKEPVEQAPAGVFQTIKYSAPNGELAAYLSPSPGDGEKHPAIIWITGGDCNSIGDVWSPAPRNNDQTAAAFRKAGIVMMFPSLRGGNDNPGLKEGFFGEVDDVLAAAKYLEKQDYVDPKRIFLGGHSTGGTLALLVAESFNRFRAVFSFGPVEDISAYGADSGLLPFNISNPKEVELRSPGKWLPSIQSPVWVFEGTGGNINSLRAMAKASTNPKTYFIEIKSADHFATLAPTNELIAKKILQDKGEVSNISFSKDEVNRNFTQ
jgi:dipeptidyl aminopeptidase/acylaminoacyl peptidase